MKAIATVIVLFASLLVHAQAPDQKSAPAKTSGTHAAAVGPRPSLLNPASLKAKAPAVFKAKFTTNVGSFVVEVHRDWAPIGADRFYNLVRSGYFKDIALFRVVPGFMCEFGIHGDPAISAKWRGANIPDDEVKGSNLRGTITYAMAGPNTRTTQLFINYADNTRLDGMGFAPFGTVVEGMDVVDKIYPGYRDTPRQDLITEQGDAYLRANFPDIDRIRLARILPTVPAAAHAPAGARSAAKTSPKSAQH